MINIDLNKFQMTVKIDYDGDVFIAKCYGSVNKLVKLLDDYDLDHVTQIIILPYLDGGKK